MTSVMQQDMGAVGHDGIEELVTNIKCKTHLLENDRKAYYEMAEATIKRNKEIINDFRQKNKALRTQVGLQIKSAAGSDNSSKIAKLDQQSAALRNKINLLEAYAVERQAHMKQLQDDLAYKRNEAESVTGRNESAEMKKLRMLENRLDKAMIKSNEAQSIRKTYQQIVKRLQQDRLQFDSQIDGLEREIKAKKKAYKKLAAMSTDAKQREELARADLTRVDNHLAESKAKHEKDLEQRRLEVEKSHANGIKGPTQNQSKTLTQQVLGTPEKKAETGEENSTQQAKDESLLVEYGKVWYKMKSVTGAATFDDVLQAVTVQKATEQDLLKIKEVSAQKIVEKKEDCAKLQKELETLKFSSASSSPSVKIMEDMESYLDKASESRDRLKSKCTRSEKICIDTEAAVAHLCQKLGGLTLPYESKEKGNREGVEVLHIVESKLVNMLRIAEEKTVKRQPDRAGNDNSDTHDKTEEGATPADTDDDDGDKDDDYEESFGMDAVKMIPTTNTRIVFDSHTKKEDDSEDEFGGNDFTDDRRQLKRKNQHAAQSQSKGSNSKGGRR